MSSQVCPLCGYDDHVVSFADEDGPDKVTFSCEDPACTGHRWTPKVAARGGGGPMQRTGIGEELGVYEDLSTCIGATDTWLEWGVIEYLYKEAQPRTYAKMVDRWGHRSTGRVDYSMSSFLAGCVGQLGREGVISTRRGPTTGYWSYLPGATQAARRPAPPDDATLTWVDLATRQGLDPDEWVL